MALGYCITILGGVCWAIGGACGQTLFEQNSITSDWVVPIRLLLAGTLLVVFSALSGKHPMAVWKDKKNYPPLIAFGLIGSALCQYGYYTSIQYSNAAFATVLSYTAPVMILVYTVVKEHRAPRLYELAAELLRSAAPLSSNWAPCTLPLRHSSGVCSPPWPLPFTPSRRKSSFGSIPSCPSWAGA